MDLKYIWEYRNHIKEMEKKDKASQAKVGFIKGLIDKKTQDIIAERDGEVTTLQRIKIKREVASDLKKSIARVGLTIAAIGITAGIVAKAGNALTEGKYNGIEITDDGVNIDSAEVGNINVELDENLVNISEKNDFEESLRVDVNNLKQIQNLVAQDEILKENVENEVDSLETFDQVRNYLKEMCVEKYNRENHTDYTVNDIEMMKHDSELLKSEAQNGDEIVRILLPNNTDFVPMVERAGYIEIYITQEDKKIKTLEKGTILKNEYKNVYGLNEEVLEDKKVNEIGKILYTGLAYSIALDNKEKNSIETMQNYKQRFESAVLEYRQAEIDKIVNPKTTEKISQAENNADERE